jgi:ribosomal protein S19E (S16A)
MQRNLYVNTSTELQTLSYILRSISAGKNEGQIVERLDGNRKLIKIWVETLQQIGFIAKNSFNKLVITPNGENYLKFDLHR